MPTNEAAPEPTPRSAWETWSLWLAVGYAALLLLAGLAIALGWTALEDTLDASRWFR
jgi:hypothetical protein